MSTISNKSLLSKVFTIRTKNGDSHKACTLQFPLPLYFGVNREICVRNNHVWVRTRDGKEVETQVPSNNDCKHIVLEETDGLSLLSLSDPSAESYHVEVEGNEIGRLVDLFK